MPLCRGKRALLDDTSLRVAESDHAQDAAGILKETLLGGTNASNDLMLEVGESIEGIDEVMCPNIERKGVNSEISSGEIGGDVTRRCMKIPRAWDAEGGDLDMGLIDDRQHGTVLNSRLDDSNATLIASLFDFEGGQRCREIEIGVRGCEEGVSYRTPNEIELCG
jgi:hypothetical protein